MIRISNIKCSVTENNEHTFLINKIQKILKIKENDIKDFKISKKSIDARKKDNVQYVYSVDLTVPNENRYLKYKDISLIKPFNYSIERKKSNSRPVIVGFGPAGMMAGLVLSKAGLNPIIIERGKEADERKKDIESFFENRILNPSSNIQFGEGGAGTFSDGKLTTGIKDPRCRYVLEEFVNNGAPNEILYHQKPHVGTDKLIELVKNIRKKIIALGGEIHFNSLVTDISIKNDCIKEITVKNGERTFTLETNFVIFAVGHSARDTFKMLNEKNVAMQSKPFSVGVRIEHNQEFINKAMYGNFHKYLPPADYKLFAHLPNGRSIYTFCMCPGGYVVGAASEKNHIVTNGMSYYSRNGENANSALLVGVYPSDYPSESVLSGIEFQKDLEHKAYIAGGKNYNAPAQTVKDYINNTVTKQFGNIIPTYRPGIQFSNINDIFPEYINESIKIGLTELNKKLNGFACDDAVLTAPETRSSSPVRILRDEKYMSSVYGLIPCGEGCGYAGGIMSAAVDGIRCAETVINLI